MPDTIKTTRYENSGHLIHRSSERDDYEQGCVADSRNVSDCYLFMLKGDTPEQFIAEVCEHFGVPVEEAELNACEDDGRIDVSRMETIGGEVPTEDEREQWMRGKLELWYMTYTLYCVKVTTEGVKLPE